MTLDLTAAVRGSCQLQFGDPTLIPQAVGDLLVPYGNEIQVSRGIRSGGFEHLVPLGIFGIQDVSLSDTPEGITIDVTGADRAQKAIDATFDEAFTIAGGTLATTAILNLVSGGMTVAETDFISRAGNAPMHQGEQGGDRWALAQDMAYVMGCDLYWSNTGVLVLRPISSLGDAPVASIVEGEDGVEVNPSLLDIGRTWSRREAHNKWIVIGVNPASATGDTPPPTATAIDDNPSSPTYYYGPFGRKPEVWNTSLSDTTAACLEAAEGKKAKEIGLTQEINFGALVKPALEPGDVVHVKRTRMVEGEVFEVANEAHILDSITIPLDAGTPMQGSTRAIQTIDV